MNLTSFDIAVLLEKAIILNGLIAFGNAAEKQTAKKEMEAILPTIHELAINYPSTSKNEVADYPFF